MQEITLEQFQKEFSEFVSQGIKNVRLTYWSQEGEADWDGTEFNIGYGIVENNQVDFDDDTIEAPPDAKEHDYVLCYSYNRNYSEDDGVFGIDIIEDWTSEELYIELTRYGKLFKTKKS